ncbi:glycoside hydrolase family 10 protein [Gracilimonas sediminicola]|uniref:Family 10 glycosylhydrolase n=1 Tax=Gracilimonas sediminicola TaxID=2952158 RepID=A0A9X2L3X4_9BACT|nr:family 10 glycosylhydrolase [Gracilimonas sediminicola]MCP9291785.1 family 10 glycosylhydrolase [Gracilimonas sediminicola]
MLSGCQYLKLSPKKPADSHPEIQREFRAAWVATVANINWPSEPGIPVEQQKEEAIKLLDLLQSTNFNAVIFQVRPQSDALYESELEPWSYYLTGQQGVPPTPYYDPLSFWIEEAHKRGLELHVWLNPYRAHHVRGGSVSEHSVVSTKEELVVGLKSGYWWFDPSLQETQDHSHAVVMDIVKRYDIDGVHFDDYFYPYPSYNFGEDFPDDESWDAYVKSGGKLSRSDWRRKAVDTFIQRVYRSIKKEKPYVKFGLSPFGVWRPGSPPSIAGMDQYEVLYADAKKWLKKGWIDYFSPQLYWPINQVPQSFPVLLGWWEEQNFTDRHIWPGMSISRYEGEQQVDEVINQIMITRGMLPEAPGTIHWSMTGLVENDSLRQALLEKPYKREALIPSMNWINHRPLKAPDISFTREKGGLSFALEEDINRVSKWVVYARYDNTWQTIIIPKTRDSAVIPYYRINHAPASSPLRQGRVSLLKELHITYIDRLGFESSAFIQNFEHLDQLESPAESKSLKGFYNSLFNLK